MPQPLPCTAHHLVQLLEGRASHQGSVTNRHAPFSQPSPTPPPTPPPPLIGDKMVQGTTHVKGTNEYLRSTIRRPMTYYSHKWDDNDRSDKMI